MLGMWEQVVGVSHSCHTERGVCPEQHRALSRACTATHVPPSQRPWLCVFRVGGTHGELFWERNGSERRFVTRGGGACACFCL